MALGAAACFTTGSLGYLYIGCGLFVGSALLDRIDGELARQTGRFSVWGHRLDLAGDCAGDALAFVCLGYGARSSMIGLLSPVLGALAAIGVVVLFWQLNRNLGGTKARNLSPLFDPDDAILAVPLLLLCFGVVPVIVLVGIATPLAALYAVWRRLTL